MMYYITQKIKRLYFKILKNWFFTFQIFQRFSLWLTHPVFTKTVFDIKRRRKKIALKWCIIWRKKKRLYYKILKNWFFAFQISQRFSLRLTYPKIYENCFWHQTTYKKNSFNFLYYMTQKIKRLYLKKLKNWFFTFQIFQRFSLWLTYPVFSKTIFETNRRRKKLALIWCIIWRQK